MSLLLLLLVGRDGGPSLGTDAEGAGRLVKLVEHAAADRLEPPPLGVFQVVGDRERAQVAERIRGRLEAVGDVASARPERRGRGRGARGPDRAARVAQQGRPLVAGRGGAVGRDECERLARREVVELGGAHELLLVLAGEPRESRCERGADQPVGEAQGDARRELRREIVAAHCPRPLAPERARRRGEREAVLLDEGAHDHRLVERRGRARRGVGLEEQPLLRNGARGALEHHGHECGPSRAPAREALESVHDLVG